MANIARPSTFSIVGCDPEQQELGVAVASKFLAVGSLVPWARAGIGAIATQSYVNATYGPLGLDFLQQGYGAEEALQGLLAADAEREERQVGMVDAHGNGATFTGSGCYSWAGGQTGRCFAAQGNILAGPEVIDAVAATFQQTEGPLVDRLVAALAAGQQAGGDSRGQQSAALLVVKPKGGYAGMTDRYVDLRVDDHPTPIDELRRLLDIHKLLNFETKAEDVLPIDEGLAREIQEILQRADQRSERVTGAYDELTKSELRALFGRENLENRWRDGTEIDRVALDYLKELSVK